MVALPELPAVAPARAVGEAHERRAVDRALVGWAKLAAPTGMPAVPAVAGLARALRPEDPPELDLQMIDRLAILAQVAEQTGKPVAFDGWMLDWPAGPRLVRAALLPARASDGSVAVTAVFGAVKAEA